MKKVLLALDGEHFPKGAFELAAEWHLKEPLLLTGVFISPVDVSKIITYTGLEAVPMMPSVVEGQYARQIARNIQTFEEKCMHAGLEYRIHNDVESMPIASLVEETRFADLVLVSRESFFANVNKDQPNEYLQELLKKAECPVLLIPEKYTAPDKVLLLYDGDASSVYAIKLFAYLFPNLTTLPATLLSTTKKADEKMPEQESVAELASRHYPQLTLNNMALDHPSQLINWILEEGNTWIVMGAYGRSLFSTLFKKSFADEFIENVRMPLFITHPQG